MKRTNPNSLLKRTDRIMSENPTADYRMVKDSCRRDKSRGRVYDIQPVNEAGDHYTGSLPPELTAEQITKVLGFPPNIKDDPNKVKHSWGFTVDGKRCGIWDYKGSCWSIYDPHHKLERLFDDAYYSNT